MLRVLGWVDLVGAHMPQCVLRGGVMCSLVHTGAARHGTPTQHESLLVHASTMLIADTLQHHGDSAQRGCGVAMLHHDQLVTCRAVGS